MSDADATFRTFFEIAGSGNFIADCRSGIFITVNTAFCALSGCAEEELLRRSLFEFVDPEKLEEVRAHFGQPAVALNDHFSFETRFDRRNEESRWFLVDCTLVRDEEGSPLHAIGVVQDVTKSKMAIAELENARKQTAARARGTETELATAEAALSSEVAQRTRIAQSLHDANQTLQTLLQASPLSILSLDQVGRIRIWNPAAERVFGWTEDEVIGKALSELALDLPPARMEELQGMMQEGRPAYFETRRQHRDGRIMDIRVWCAPHFSSQGVVTGYVAIIMDVTREKLLQRALLDAGEREQRRIGQDLHDHLCQQLLGAAFAAKALAGRMDRDGTPMSGELHHLATVINEAVKQARDIARGLNPVELDAAGLMAALQEMAASLRPAVDCVLECNRPMLLPDREAALHAYRIAQEAVTNSVKHGSPSRIVIRLTQNRDSVLLEISDNGSGIDPATATTGMGLESMRYRAEAIGGKLSIEAVEGGGTRVSCRFPKRK